MANKAIPKYVIDAPAFIDGKHTWASKRITQEIETLAVPSRKWQPLNQAAFDALEALLAKDMERHKGDLQWKPWSVPKLPVVTEEAAKPAGKSGGKSGGKGRASDSSPV